MPNDFNDDMFREHGDVLTTNTTNTFNEEVLTRLAALEATGQTNTDSATTSDRPAGAVGTCVVTLVRQGKSGSQTIEVPVGTSIPQVMSLVGWEHQNHSFKHRVGAGPISEVSSPDSTTLGPVDNELGHFIIASPRVVGG